MNVYSKVKAPAPRPTYDGAKADLSHLAGMTPEQIIARMQEEARAEAKVFRIVVMEQFPDKKRKYKQRQSGVKK